MVVQKMASLKKPFSRTFDEGEKRMEAGLCETCVHQKLIESDRGRKFVMCALSVTNPDFPKYPRLPVLECSGYEPQRTS